MSVESKDHAHREVAHRLDASLQDAILLNAKIETKMGGWLIVNLNQMQAERLARFLDEHS